MQQQMMHQQSQPATTATRPWLRRNSSDPVIPRSQVATAQRNKGIICQNYHNTKKCPLANCPYLHVEKDEVVALPFAVCRFYQGAKCLKDNCRYFHGSPETFSQLKNLHATSYKPSEILPVRDPLDITDGCEPVQLPTQWPPPVPIPPPQPQQFNLPASPQNSFSTNRPQYAPPLQQQTTNNVFSCGDLFIAGQNFGGGATTLSLSPQLQSLQAASYSPQLQSSQLAAFGPRTVSPQLQQQSQAASFDCRDPTTTYAQWIPLQTSSAPPQIILLGNSTSPTNLYAMLQQPHPQPPSPQQQHRGPFELMSQQQ